MTTQGNGPAGDDEYEQLQLMYEAAEADLADARIERHALQADLSTTRARLSEALILMARRAAFQGLTRDEKNRHVAAEESFLCRPDIRPLIEAATREGSRG